MEKNFTFSTPDAINIAYVVKRNQSDPLFLHKLLIRALNLENVRRSQQNGRE